ncbi:MAG: NTP transferase domain-containing protein [Thermoplasmataceae archaeon]
MLGIIPVKMSERLPGKHLLKIGGTTLLESVVNRVSAVMEVQVYSRVSIPIPYVPDSSSNIMELVSELTVKYGAFMLVGGDMPFFTLGDLKKLLDNYSGRAAVPRHPDGRIEPMFAIYSGKLKPQKNLIAMIHAMKPVYIDAAEFSRYAFFNINTEEDYRNATGIRNKMDESGNIME